CLNKAPRPLPPLNPASSGDPYNLIAPMTNSSTYYDGPVYAHMNLDRTYNPFHWAILTMASTGVSTAARPNYTDIHYLSSVSKAWELDAADCEKSAMWDSDPESGLGSLFGNSEDDHILKTGGLNISLAYPVYVRLTRAYLVLQRSQALRKLHGHAARSRKAALDV
ncbi:hypothetical protein FS749_003609, partial [Ceratobasidium sp. UAMH 11750]